MIEPQECPECGSWKTETVHMDVWPGEIVRVRICKDCPTEYTVAYGDPVVRDVHQWDDGGEGE